MNNWTFTGHIAADCESRFTPSGDAVVSFSVGVKSGFGDKATTTWARCQMWGKRGESVAPYLTKGQLVGIVGELSVREYQDKQGQTKTSVDVRVNDLTLLGKKQDSESAPRQAAQQSQQARPQQARQAPAPDAFDDQDIPF